MPCDFVVAVCGLVSIGFLVPLLYNPLRPENFESNTWYQTLVCSPKTVKQIIVR